MHTTALKRIGRYLLKTSDRGIILKPHQNSLLIVMWMQIFLVCGIKMIMMMKIVLKAELDMCYELANALFFGLLAFKKE